MDAMPLTIYTIGHSNVPAEMILALLQRHGVRRVVDVRTSPYSKYTAQFNREGFSQFLKRNGIEYHFAGEVLGGRPTDPACYKRGVVPEGQANYLRLVDYREVAKKDWYRRGIDRLMTLATEQPTAILCSEGDPYSCHRHHLIARTLLEQGVIVHHIREEATQEEILRSPDDWRDDPDSGDIRQLPLF